MSKNGLVADDRAIDHPEQISDSCGDLVAIARTREIGLAGGGVVARDLGHRQSRLRRKWDSSTVRGQLLAGPTASLERLSLVLRRRLDLVAGVEEGREGNVRFPPGVVEP